MWFVLFCWMVPFLVMHVLVHIKQFSLRFLGHIVKCHLCFGVVIIFVSFSTVFRDLKVSLDVYVFLVPVLHYTGVFRLYVVEHASCFPL